MHVYLCSLKGRIPKGPFRNPDMQMNLPVPCVKDQGTYRSPTFTPLHHCHTLNQVYGTRVPSFGIHLEQRLTRTATCSDCRLTLHRLDSNH
jgi:hypothetical protein